jgi:hypothetical protein
MKLALDDQSCESRPSITVRQSFLAAAGSFTERDTPRQALAMASGKVSARVDREIFSVG